MPSELRAQVGEPGSNRLSVREVADFPIESDNGLDFLGGDAIRWHVEFQTSREKQVQDADVLKLSPRINPVGIPNSHEGRAMTPYYEGTSEAEHLSRGSPELVEPWLKKARQDRSRLAIRLFQPQRKEFLDGFINSLEGYIASRASRRVAAEQPPELPVESPVEVMAAEVDEVDASIAVDADRADHRTEPRVDEELTAPEVPAEPHRDQVEPDATVATIATNQQTEPAVGRSQLDADAERAAGIMRLSGWTVDVDPREIEPGEGDDPAANPVEDSSVQTGEPVPSIAWNRVFEQARGVGMVDLSAYDFIDGLGELRDLIDHWQKLHDDAGSVDHPTH